MRRHALSLLAALLACAHRAGPPPADASPAGAADPAEPASTFEEPGAPEAADPADPVPPAAPAAPPAPPPAPPAAAAPARAAPAEDAALARLRADADAVLRAQAEAYWGLFTRGDAIDPAAPWKGREALLSDASLQRVAAAIPRAAGDERRALEHLRAWLVGERLARDAAEEGRRLSRARAAATVTWDGRAASERDVPGLLAAEHDRERRRALAGAADAAARGWLPLADARVARLSAAAQALGHGTTLDLATELRHATPAALGALAEGVLARTDATWRALLAEQARREGLPDGEVHARDLPRLLRSAVPAAAFPAGRALDAAAALAAGLGLDLAAQRNLRLDAEARAGKLPGTIALPVEPPGDVRLSFAPTAGLEALRGLLHELGAAEAWAHAPRAPVELARLGPASLPEAWGILLEEVAGAPDWLEARGLDADVARSEARTAAARRLLRAREAAARVLAELARARDPAGAAAGDPALLARALGTAEDPEALPSWRTDPDPLLRSAEGLRAELLAAQAELQLAAAAGDAPWWRAPAAGARLVGLWSEGSRPTPEELSRALGQPALDAEALDRVVRTRAGL